MKNPRIFAFLAAAVSVLTMTAAGRTEISLNGEGWTMWQDKAAEWQNDRLWLPWEINDISELPVNPPTGGWDAPAAQGIAVAVPGTVEEYVTVSSSPRPGDQVGVSWWVRPIRVDEQGKLWTLHFESVRMRAEVYLDGRLVGYDIVGESPFDVDLTPYITPGREQVLSVRVTNPGGNFHWQDFDQMRWGDYKIPPGRGFGGIIGRVKLTGTDPVRFTDMYLQNQPEPHKIKAILTVDNTTNKSATADIEVSVAEKETGRVIATRSLSKQHLATGAQTVTVDFDCPDAALWNIDTPNLYVCRATLRSGKHSDEISDRFGFRWFTPRGVGEDAWLDMNGHRVMLRSAISWGYWPSTGLYATEEMARKQVLTAKEMGLNMLNFHRSIGSPVVLEVADSIGLYYFEEPGSFHSADHDPFLRAMVNTKLQRMVRRDRNHPSLIIYNLINEWGGPRSRDAQLTAKRMNDMRRAHAIDPSRVMTFTSGWAGKEFADEDAKAHMMPFDTTLYRRGWFDNHRASGPSTWESGYYRSPEDNIMYTTNRTEVYMRGEEGAISTPPRIELINADLDKGRLGWDGHVWRSQYAKFEQFFADKHLAQHFGTIDSLTRAMGDVQLDHQGRRIQQMRMHDIGDIYVINGWEAMPYDNHSGVVDIYRNPKGNASTLARYNRPLFVAVNPRQQIAVAPAAVRVDFDIINEVDLSGDYRLRIETIDSDGTRRGAATIPVTITGGRVFGEPLARDMQIELGSAPGMHTIATTLLDADGNAVADGSDQVLILAENTPVPAGRGAIYGSDNDPVATYYKSVTGRELPQFTADMHDLDWIVVTRTALNEPTQVPADIFTLGIKAELFDDNDIGHLAATIADTDISHSFQEGAQPYPQLPANQPFSVLWTTKIIIPRSGTYLLGLDSNQGARMWVNNVHVIDEWSNRREQRFVRSLSFEKGQEVEIRVMYRQLDPSGHVNLVWTTPENTKISPESLLSRAADEGTTIVLLNNAEAWMGDVDRATGCGYHGYYIVGHDWVGGQHFAVEHPMLADLPSNTAMAWPYQLLVHDGNARMGLRIDREEMIAGSYASAPFNLGSALGIIPHGKGRIVYNTLDVASNLNNPAPEAAVARLLFQRMAQTGSPVAVPDKN